MKLIKKAGHGLQFDVDGDVPGGSSGTDLSEIESRISALEQSGVSGGGSCADWEENDPTAHEYVKNRTHYSEIGLNRPSSGTYLAEEFFGLVDFTDYIKPENLPIPVTTVDYSFDANTQELVFSEPVLTGESLTKTFDYNGQPAYASDGVTYENGTLSGNGYMAFYTPQSILGSGGTVLASVENGTQTSSIVSTGETTGYFYGISMQDYEVVHKLPKKYIPVDELKIDVAPDFTDYGNGNDSVGPGYGGNYKVGVWVEAILGDTYNRNIVGFSGVSGQVDSNGLSIDGYSDMAASKLNKLLQLGDTVSLCVLHDILAKAPKAKISYSEVSGNNTYTADNQEVEFASSTRDISKIVNVVFSQENIPTAINIQAVNLLSGADLSNGKCPLRAITYHQYSSSSAGFTYISGENVSLLQFYLEFGTGYSDALDYSAMLPSAVGVSF